MLVRRRRGASRARNDGSNPATRGSTAAELITSGGISPPLSRAAALSAAQRACGWASPSPSCWTTSTGTRRTIDGRTCGWSVPTVTPSYRHTRAATAAAAASTADSDTPTVNRSDREITPTAAVARPHGLPVGQETLPFHDWNLASPRLRNHQLIMSITSWLRTAKNCNSIGWPMTRQECRFAWKELEDDTSSVLQPIPFSVRIRFWPKAFGLPPA
jgi:hypothetical protein